MGTNDLASLKKFFDGGTSGIEKNVNAVQYSYNITPQIFASDTSQGVRKINPNEAFAALGFSSTKSSSSLLNASMNMNTFYELAEDTNLFQSQYDTVAGRWPQKYNECLVVLTPSGRIPDMLLYQLGFRDSKELDQMVQNFMDGKQVQKPTTRMDVSYDSILSKKMTIIPNVAYYKHNSQYNIWEDMSGNESYMKGVIKKGETLKIVGIVQPSGNSKTTALNPGIYYTSALTHRLMEQAASSKIVKDQLASPKVDVFTGKTFKAEAQKKSDTGLDFTSMFTVDSAKMQSAFSLDTSKLTNSMSKYFDLTNLDLGDLQNIDLPMPNLDPADLASAVDIQKAQTLVNDLMLDYINNGGGMMIPTNKRTAEVVAVEAAKKLGLAEPSVISREVLQDAEGTRIELKGKVTFDIDVDKLVIPPEPTYLTEDEIREDIEKYPMKLVCGTVGEDEHSVGLREIIDIKHGGIERFGIEVHYLGTSVPVEKLVDAAVELKAEVILASTIISHDNIHYKNMKRIHELAVEKGIRDQVIIAAGGTQVIPEEGVKTGIDAAFGRNSHGIDVASFLVEERRRRRG